MRSVPILSLMALFACILLVISSCKKDQNPISQPVVQDFRDNFKGKYQVTFTGIADYHPSVDTFKDDTTINTYLLTIDYATTDSIDRIAYLGGNLPAIHLKYSNGKEEYLGINPDGTLLRTPGMNTVNKGGFIGKDSINHSYTDPHTTSTDKQYIVGKRLP